MNARTPRLGWIVALLLATGFVGASDARWTLRVRLDPGESHRLAMTHLQSMQMDLGPMGRQQMENSARIEMLQVVEETGADGSFVLDTVYERMRTKLSAGAMAMEFDTAAEGEPTHPMAKLQRHMTGKHFRMTVTPRGAVERVEGLDAILDGLTELFPDQPGAAQALDVMKQSFDEDAVKTMLAQSMVLYPEGPVAIGDTWERQFDLPNPSLGTLEVDADYRVQAAERKRERDCLKIGVTSAIRFDEENRTFGQLARMLGAELKLDISDARGDGTIWVDVATVLVVDSRMQQTIEMDLSFQVPAQEGGEPQDLQMSAVVTQEIAIELID